MVGVVFIEAITQSSVSRVEKSQFTPDGDLSESRSLNCGIVSVSGTLLFVKKRAAPVDARSLT